MTEPGSEQHPVTPGGQEPDVPMPEVNELGFDDLKECLLKGMNDFARAPRFGLVIGSVFTLGGILIILSLTVWKVNWLVYPAIMGFPLVGPYAAVGLYEVSRRREKNLPLQWKEILKSSWFNSKRELQWMAFVMLFIFWIWIYQVRLLVAIILGEMSFATWARFLEIITTTTEGLIFILVGHVVGAFLAMVLFSVTVVSIPLLLDRDVDFITAMITSISTVFKSPVVMLSWGVFVTLAVIASFIPMFLGLLIVLPVLGHTTWHIYKKAVV